jgi:hypothetical protein
VIDRVEALTPQLMTDLGVNKPGRHNGRPAVPRQPGHAGSGLAVEAIGLLEQALDHILQRRTNMRGEQPAVGLQARLLQPLAR